MIKVEIARHPAGDLIGIDLGDQLRVLTVEEAQQLANKLNEILLKRTVEKE